MIDDVQSNWNKIEEILITVTDKLAPICEFTDNVSSKSRVVPTIIKRKITSRKSLVFFN